jgi:hypothetical protein
MRSKGLPCGGVATSGGEDAKDRGEKNGTVYAFHPDIKTKAI